jgi:hypothetical protein
MPSFSTFDGAQYPRLFAQATTNNALYMLQTDATKSLTLPITMNDIVDGTGNGAYTNRVTVPAGARAFLPYFVSTINITTTASTARMSSLSLTFTHASATPAYLIFMGRMTAQSSPYANDPYAAGLTNAVNPATYGYWVNLARGLFTASSGGTGCVIAYEDFSGQTPMTMAIPTAGGTNNANRTYVTNMGATATSGPAGFQYPTFAMQSSTTPVAPMNVEAGMVPTHGCTEIAAFFTFASNTAGTIASSVTMTSGTATVSSVGIGCSFVS